MWARAKQSSETRLRRSKSSTNKQLAWFSLGFAFVFAFVPQKRFKKKCSSSGETSMSAGKTKPRSTTLALLPSAAPNHKASTLSCFEKSQPEKNLPSQLRQVELVLTQYIFNLIIWSFASYLDIPHSIEPRDYKASCFCCGMKRVLLLAPSCATLSPGLPTSSRWDYNVSGKGCGPLRFAILAAWSADLASWMC